jgi:gluconolactonase
MKLVVSTIRACMPLGLAISAVLSPPNSVSAQTPLRSIERLDPALDALIASDAKIELLAEGFDWTEGPVWNKAGGYLLFSDIPRNAIHKWKEGQGVSVYMRPAGFSGATPFGRELGSNGLTFDANGELVMADHGNRQVSRVDSVKFTKTTLADRYNGKRLNSPNDVVFSRAGDLFFTDPPYGLWKLNADPAKELDFNGVYRLSRAGALTLLTRELTFPNGIALSPDERTLYVSVSDPARPIWMAYDLQTDGTITRGRVFFDASALARAGRQGLPDGMKVDAAGNVFASGPGGILVFSPQGKHLGTIVTGETTANCAFGDDGSTLYMTANHTLMRVRLRTKGPGF